MEIILNEVERTTVETTYLEMPYWVELVAHGEKIKAIRELRDIISPSMDHVSGREQMLGLKQAKELVETFTIATRTQQGKIL